VLLIDDVPSPVSRSFKLLSKLLQGAIATQFQSVDQIANRHRLAIRIGNQIDLNSNFKLPTSAGQFTGARTKDATSTHATDRYSGTLLAQRQSIDHDYWIDCKMTLIANRSIGCQPQCASETRELLMIRL